MKYAASILDLIGNTPLVKINMSPRGEIKDALLLAKLESKNPGGSVKDRIAQNMIETAEKQGLISPQKTTIIEPTSGNTGIGLAMVCATKGYKLILVMPESMSLERKILLRAYGADLVLTPADLGMGGAIEKATELVKSLSDSFMPQQFKNLANPEIHSKTTALEILRDTDEKVDILIAGVGTGGTLTGIGRVLKERNPSVKIVAVEPEESAVLSGCAAGKHKIQGIGAGFIPEILDMKLIDQISKVSSDEAIETSRFMARSQGLLIGISSGAALKAAFDEAFKPENKDKVIVTIIPSSGERYLSTALFEKEAREFAQ